MFERIKHILDQWHRLEEVDKMSDRDLDDLGLTREQVKAFLQMPDDVGERVRGMATVFGLSAEELQLDHPGWVELLYTCGQCKDRAKCSHVLALGPLADPHDCGFCLNAESFEAQAEASAA